MFLDNKTNLQKNKFLSFMFGIHMVNIFTYFNFKFWNINYFYSYFGFIIIIILYIIQLFLIYFLNIDEIEQTYLKIIYFFIAISPTVIVFILNYISKNELEEYIKSYNHHIKKENI